MCPLASMCLYFLLGIYVRVEPSAESQVFSAVVGTARQLSKVACTSYILNSSVKFLVPPHSCPNLLLFVSKIWAILVGQWYYIVILIYISSCIILIDHLFQCLLAILIFIFLNLCIYEVPVLEKQCQLVSIKKIFGKSNTVM